MLKLFARNRQKSFLWSIVRDPTKRYVSDFFHFQVSRRNVEPTLANMKSYFDNYKHKHHYIDWLSTTSYEYNKDKNTKNENKNNKSY